MKVNEPGLVWLILMSECHPGNVHLVMGDYPVLGREGETYKKTGRNGDKGRAVTLELSEFSKGQH